MCLIITFYVLFSREDELNDSYYVPKSKRWIMYRAMKMFMINKLNKVYDRIMQHAQSIKTDSNYRMKQAKFRRATRNTRTKKDIRDTLRSVTVMTIIALQAQQSKYSNNVSFDTDSERIGIDNRC